MIGLFTIFIEKNNENEIAYKDEYKTLYLEAKKKSRNYRDLIFKIVQSRSKHLDFLIFECLI